MVTQSRWRVRNEGILLNRGQNLVLEHILSFPGDSRQMPVDAKFLGHRVIAVPSVGPLL
jgi:hypothetical protein